MQIRLLGDFRLTWDDRIVSAAVTARMRSLLGYLILRRGAPQLRAHLAFLFWPDSSEQQALTNLRHLLHELRKTLPEIAKFLQADSRTVVWKADAACALDVSDFEHALACAQEATQRADHAGAKAALEQAAQAYQGDLLPGCDGDWIETERERLRQEYGNALERLVGLHEQSRDYRAAIRHAQRLRQLDPVRETTWCTLMRLHLLSGDRATALVIYQECVATLQRELNVGPGQALRDFRERVLGDTSAARVHPLAGAGSDAPEFSLHGRDAEWRALRAAWRDAAAGRAGMVVILGEAGIGKTRLAEELCVWVERQQGAVARTRSYAAEGRLAYAPAAQWLRSPTVRKKLTCLDAVWLTEVMRILPELGLEHPELRRVALPEETWQRHHLFEALSRAVLAGGGPLLLCLDDMQWTDQETLEWLRYLMHFAPAARLLVVASIRNDELPSHEPSQRLLADLRRDDQLTEIELAPLSEAEVAAVARDVAGRDLTRVELEQLYAQTEGNPLFVVESVRAGWRGEIASQSGLPPVALSPVGTSLPPKVHAVITTRLARLSTPARELAGVAAVIGRAFTFEILAAVCDRPEAALVPLLEELWQHRIVREQRNGAYDFTHDKLREVAYAGILSPRRRMLHRRAAEALEKAHASDPDAVRAQIAAHLAESGQTAAAIDAYHRAAEAAKNLHATEEAIRLFQKALRLLALLPENPARAVQELELNTELGVCLVASQGYPAPGVWGIYERAVDLCRQLNRPTAPPILRALAIASLVMGDLKRAHALGEELLGLFEQQRDPVVFVEGHYVLGVTCFWLGRFEASRVHLEQALARYDPRLRHTHISLYAQDPKAVCLCRLAWTLWYLGRPGPAIARLDEALAYAHTLEHPHTEGYVLFFGAQVAFDLRDETRVGELLGALERLAARHTLPFWEDRGKTLKDFLRAGRTGAKVCRARAREAMAASVRYGDVVYLTQSFGIAANLFLLQGAVVEGRAAIAEAFELMKRTDPCYYSAELHRLDGELLRAGGANADAQEACFHQALLVAREQGAKSLELRAAMSLGRVWQGQRKTAQARKLLESVYRSFGKECVTADLEEARVLLDEWK
jgi:DNA-binding SARP family transcriptional activator